jgi:hypothetical protein
VQAIRARNPRAYLLFWATDLGGTEIQTEVARVVDRLHSARDARTGFVAVNDLRFAGCNAHPDLADDQTIADALIRHLDALPGVWAKR